MERKRIAIVGATSKIAEHCARLWLQDRPVVLTLIGRDFSRIEQVAADLRIRSPSSEIRVVVQADFCDPVAIQSTVDTIDAQGAIDTVLIAHGSLPEQDHCQKDITVCRDVLSINGISPALYAEAFAKHMSTRDQGAIALISSVAGDRGRKSNYVYGAAKSLVTHYAQGLQHRFAGTGVKVVLVKPGPTLTPMTAHLDRQGYRLADAKEVAREIVAAISCGRPVVYAPAKWRLIMWIIRKVPARLFHRLDI